MSCSSQIDRDTDSKRNRLTETQIDIDTNKQIDRETKTPIATDTDIQRQTDREKQIEKDAASGTAFKIEQPNRPPTHTQP